MTVSSTPVVELQASLRPPVGRPFTPGAEAELLQDLLQLSATIRATTGHVVAIPELVGPFGVADLVAVVDSTGALNKRLIASVPALLHSNDAEIVSVMSPRFGRATEEIAEALLWTDLSIVERRLPRLIKVGAVNRQPGGRYVRHPSLVPVGRLHAFEAKVRNWRAGVDQARTYALWADSATLGMAILPQRRDEVRRELQRWSLGLAQRRQWLVRPVLRRHKEARRLWASEHVVAALKPTSEER